MSKTILLADDSVTIRKVVELTFMDESFDLVSVGDGSEALERCEGVDLVIADVHMPGADGYEVCQEVKKRAPGTPVLLLVGTFETFDEAKAADAGADDHLKKPFDSQDLLTRVRNLLDQSEDEATEGESETGLAEATAGESEPALRVTPPSDPESGDLSAQEVGADSADAGDEAEDDGMSEASVDRIARRVVELLSEEAIREVAWEVIPDLAEVVIKERLDELESQVE